MSDSDKDFEKNLAEHEAYQTYASSFIEDDKEKITRHPVYQFAVHAFALLGFFWLLAQLGITQGYPID